MTIIKKRVMKALSHFLSKKVSKEELSFAQKGLFLREVVAR